LLKQLDDSHRSLRHLSVLDIDAYLSKKAREGWQRRSLRTAADALRSFVRYAEQRRWCRSGIVAAIDPPRIYQQESLVSYIQWRDVNALLKETKGHNARDIRDRAIFLLLARYGLRGCEVRGLRLEDIDWEHDLLLIRRSKQRCTQQYP
ncbi:integrase family protein, partial [mine drainage metagenome]